LVKLVCAQATEKRCREQAERMAQVLQYEIDRQGLPETDIIGPAPAYHRRVRGKYRWQLVVRGGRVQELLRTVVLPLGWTVDVDPMNVL